MLSKLMKHEFRATARLMLPLYLVVLLLAVGARISVTWLLEASFGVQAIDFLLHLLGVLLMIGFGAGLVAAVVVSVVIMILRYRSNLLGDEGYVMFTLPVSTHHLVWSKLLVSTVWFAGAALVDILAVVIVVLNSHVFQNLGSIISDVIASFSAYYAANGILLVIELLVLLVLSAFALCLQFYAPLSIGHSFDKHKMLLSVVFFFVIQTASQVVSSLLVAGSLVVVNIGALASGLAPAITLHGTLWASILLSLLLCVVLYIINHLFLSRKLNLE